MSIKHIHVFNITPLSRVLLLLLLIICIFGSFMQHSAGGGDVHVYALSYISKCLIAFVLLFILIKIDLKIIFLLTNYFYYFALALLVLVDLIGIIRLGAQRWINLGLFVVQPSEIMKIALILMLAKYFHNFSISQTGKLKFYLQPLFLSIIPFMLILKQPDLGTSIIIAFIASVLFFLSGFKLRYFMVITGIVLVLLPMMWFSLHNYQKQRVLTFLNPDRDPKGAGYHIIQSKIAIGSGGLLGKGYLSGTQSQLDFLPEKHTDFIFTLISEEFGFVGATTLILLYLFIIITCIIMSYRCTYSFGRYVIASVTGMFFIYIFINIGMVSGLLPVVGVPLPLVSYGGTAIIMNMIGFGLILNIENNKNYN